MYIVVTSNLVNERDQRNYDQSNDIILKINCLRILVWLPLWKPLQFEPVKQSLKEFLVFYAEFSHHFFEILLLSWFWYLFVNSAFKRVAGLPKGLPDSIDFVVVQAVLKLFTVFSIVPLIIHITYIINYLKWFQMQVFLLNISLNLY